TSEPSRSHHSLLDNDDNDDDDDDDDDNDDDDDDLSTSSRSHYNKPIINIHIGRSPIPSSSTTDLPLDTSSPISSQTIESSSPYAMSPALSNIADQYNDDDDDDDEEEKEEEENNSDSYSIIKKRKLDNNDIDHERNKVFKSNSDQS
ncbi:unnamed protein product, partial [Rotaria sordida]